MTCSSDSFFHTCSRMRLLLVFLLAVAATATAFTATAQSLASNESPMGHAEIRARLLGSSEIRFPGESRSPVSFPPREDVRRSVPLAFGLSALIPGAGQAYNQQWKKALVAVGVEAVVLTIWSVTRSRGRSAEDDFRALAHRNWNPGRYATWLNDYVTFLERDFGLTVIGPAVSVPSGIDFSQPGSWSAQELAVVRGMFDQIRAIERQVFHPETGATFTHQLPGFGEQQYYELIGKYFQFAPGWADYPAWIDSEGVFTIAIDPEFTGEDGSKPNVSPMFFSYARDHAGAQDLLRVASRLSTLFVVNHLIAGIDAAVTAKLGNDRIDTRLGLAYGVGGRPTPVAVVSFSF